MKIDNSIAPSYGGIGGSVGAPLPINKVDYATAFSRVITRDDFIRLMATDAAIGISGNFIYFDPYGERYETTFCLLHFVTGDIAYCKEGNDIK